MALAAVCFNTQPPEGGWLFYDRSLRRIAGFNTQPPEGGWKKTANKGGVCGVSTHSRLKAAGKANMVKAKCFNVPTHSRLKAAGNGRADAGNDGQVSTHSRLKAAGVKNGMPFNPYKVSTHSRLKAAGIAVVVKDSARQVSTHSRLKAAGGFLGIFFCLVGCFNTQPPEGGWLLSEVEIRPCRFGFNTQPPEGGWLDCVTFGNRLSRFQHTAA